MDTCESKASGSLEIILEIKEEKDGVTDKEGKKVQSLLIIKDEPKLPAEQSKSLHDINIDERRARSSSGDILKCGAATTPNKDPVNLKKNISVKIERDSDHDIIMEVVGNLVERSVRMEAAEVGTVGSGLPKQVQSKGPSLSSATKKRQSAGVKGKEREKFQKEEPPAGNHISRQMFQCMLCDEGKNRCIPLDQILIHRYEHYKAFMSYEEYIQGLDQYPVEFKKPQPMDNNNSARLPHCSTSSQCSGFRQPVSNTVAKEVVNSSSNKATNNSSPSQGYPLHGTLESAPSYAVEVTVSTDQQGDSIDRDN